MKEPEKCLVSPSARSSARIRIAPFLTAWRTAQIDPERMYRATQQGRDELFWRIAGKLLICLSSVSRAIFEDVMDVSTWLQGLGVERHEAAFRDNLIDMDVVRELNENDLEKLGLPLGDRKSVRCRLIFLRCGQPYGLPPRQRRVSCPISASTRNRGRRNRGRERHLFHPRAKADRWHRARRAGQPMRNRQ